MIILLATLLLSGNVHAADGCFGRRMDCYLDVYTACGPTKGGNDSCQKKLLANCEVEFPCVGANGVKTGPVETHVNYKLESHLEYDSNCSTYRDLIESRMHAAVSRLQECFNYAFVRDDIAKRMSTVLAPGAQGIRVHCQEPPRSSWCAAAGYGDIYLSPSRMLSPSGICFPDMGAMVIHELAHVAGLKMSSSHNEMGETNELDEVYGLQNYCFRPTRMWIKRAIHTADVVDATHISCVRDYQEFTPSTDRDPFWGEYRKRVDHGQDPCPASLEPVTQPAPGRRGD